MGAQSFTDAKCAPSFTYLPLEHGVSFSAAADFNAAHNPGHTCFAYADADGVVRKVTYLEFGRAMHRAAHALRPAGKEQDGSVVAFIALSDTLVYHAVVTGLVKAGLVPFPISPRLSAPAIANLLRTSGSRRLVTTQYSLHGLIESVKDELGADYALEVDEVPALSVLYPHLAEETAADAFEAYPDMESTKTPDDFEIYMHSSGSTGFPKAIGHTRAGMAGWVRLASVTDVRRFTPRPLFAAHILPPFHAFAIYIQLIVPLYGGAAIALFEPVARTPHDVPPPPTPDHQLSAARASGSTAIITVPAYLQIWATDPEAIDFMKDLQVVGFGGGPLSDAAGNALSSAGVKLRSIYGATEFGVPTHIAPSKDEDWKEWRWIELDLNAQLAWEPQGDDSEELIITANEGHWHQPAVKNTSTGYATSDLWARHPTKPYLQRIVGRKDDVIVHSTGEKTVPAPMENVVLASPLVRVAIMFGRGRDEAGILIEPAPRHAVDVNDDAQLAAFRNAVWPVIEEANRGAPGYSRIFKELILVTHPDKPLPRTAKGTVMRKLALQAYDDEIKKIYEIMESHAVTGEDGVQPPATWDVPDVRDWLSAQVRDITGRNMDASADLFEQGFDSLNATVLRLRMIGGLKTNATTPSAAHAVSQNVVYEHPTVENLASLLAKLVRGETAAAPAANAQEEIIAMAAKYSEGLPGYVDAVTLPKYVPSTNAASLKLPAGVLLTGTTGNLGAELLAMFLADDRVSRVYTLERAGSVPARERQRARFADKGLDVGLLESSKLVALAGHLSEERLGQSEAVYAEMLDVVNVVCHIAWRLDFNLGVNAFKSSIGGTRALVDFARQARQSDNLRFIFTNSIASAFGWDGAARGSVPEELIEDAGVSVAGGGYGQSKYVAERVLAASGIAFSSMRVGQISGGKPRGAWATSDWFPILVKTSLALGMLPSDEQSVAWLSMDAVAGTLADAAFSDGALLPSHNVVHPRPVPWTQMIENVQESLKSILQRDVPIVSFQEWFAKLEAAAGDPSVDVRDMPGVKLLEFYRGISSGNTQGMSEYATEKMQAVSETLRTVPPVSQSDADAWVTYWTESGLLP
ncbi:hypothetical protein BD626DRAFT_618939 [Schizophyllum amplum]|uniref:Polyketide synthase-like phosphopantetheine-binding domain-containing protein n=1 Tax=Schizophyllum amplum TaxID=97359 RepID=A0A550BVG9_9AGAR|nr:hypothetical protein BD626DRAFT_618939 [Auriculariopsis ampla]